MKHLIYQKIGLDYALAFFASIFTSEMSHCLKNLIFWFRKLNSGLS